MSIKQNNETIANVIQWEIEKRVFISKQVVHLERRKLFATDIAVEPVTPSPYRVDSVVARVVRHDNGTERSKQIVLHRS